MGEGCLFRHRRLQVWAVTSHVAHATRSYHMGKARPWKALPYWCAMLDNVRWQCGSELVTRIDAGWDRGTEGPLNLTSQNLAAVAASVRVIYTPRSVPTILGGLDHGAA